MRAIITLAVGIALAVGAFYLARTAGLTTPGGGASHPEIVFTTDVDLTTELDKLAAGAKPIIKIPMGEKARERATEAFYSAPDGSTILFEEGKYEFDSGLQVGTSKDITVKGAGIDKTILNFEGQLAGTGGEGILAKSDGFTVEDLTVEETKGDAIKIEGADRVVMRRVATVWHNEGNPKNGAYGLYPVQCKNVLIEYCVAEGASDAGIYVGQSENIIVRYSKAEKNVAGIEIENSKHADVYENEATNNAGGLLVFDLPGLPKGNGGGVRVYNNRIYENNHVNFAPEGNIVASVPQGTGVMVMATDDVEVFDNKIENNQSANMSVISFLFTRRPFEDKNYDPYAEGIYVHDNTFVGGGEDPQGSVKPLALLIGKPLPDVVVDGLANPESKVDGKLPEEKRIVFENNKDADYINLRLDLVEDLSVLNDPAKAISVMAQHKDKIERDMNSASGKLASLPAVELEGVVVE